MTTKIIPAFPPSANRITALIVAAYQAALLRVIKVLLNLHGSPYALSVDGEMHQNLVKDSIFKNWYATKSSEHVG